MATLNRVLLIGNLTRDPELRYTPGGKAVTTLGLAVNSSFRRDKDTNRDTCFINVVVWANLAEVCNQYLQKGKSVFVEGRLQYRNWQDAQGKKHSVIEVVAERVQFLSPRPQAGPEADLGHEPDQEPKEQSTSEQPVGEEYA